MRGSVLFVRNLSPDPADYEISTLTVRPLQMRVLMAVH